MSTLIERLRERRSVLDSLSDSDLYALAFVFEANPEWEDVYLFASGEIEHGDEYRSGYAFQDRGNLRSGCLMATLSRGIPMNVSRNGMKFYAGNSSRVFRCHL